MFEELNKKVNLFDYKPNDPDLFMGTNGYYESYLKGADGMEGSEITVPCHGCFFFNTINGESGAMILPECNVYIPKHMLGTFQAICENAEMVNAIKEGKLGVQMYEYTSKKQKKQCVGVRLVDIKG